MANSGSMQNLSNSDPDNPAPPENKHTGPYRAFRTFAFLCGLAVALFLGGFLFFINEIPKTGTENLPRADGIVALTGAADRIEIAVGLLHAGKGQRLLISGVNTATTRNALGSSMPQFANLFACCIDLDYQALNTVGNANETRKWVEDQGFMSVIIVTSNYHMPRSLIEIERAMPNIMFIPYPVVTERVKIDQWWSNPGSLKLLASEYLKYLEAILRSNFHSAASTIMGTAY
ncbi:MAG: YdcF family protein [Rhizobiales bacterium]|nr:YdcF family protein [Hyphomicrobiales bacterium]